MCVCLKNYIRYFMQLEKWESCIKLGSKRLLSLTFESFPQYEKAAPRFGTKWALNLGNIKRAKIGVTGNNVIVILASLSFST